MRRLCALVGLATATFAVAAHASPQARLVYGRTGAADSCPDETALRRAVAARIGYDPFFPTARQTVIVTIAGKGDRLVAHVQLVDNDGHAQGVRELDSSGADCGSLFDTVALTVSIAIDPQSLVRPSPPPALDPPTPEPVAPPEPGLAPAPPAKSHAVHPPPEPSNAPPDDFFSNPRLNLGIALRGSLWQSPEPAVGASVYAGVSWAKGSIGLEAQGALPASHGFASDSTVTAWFAAGALVPCLRFAPVDVCALAVVGRLDATASGVIAPAERAGLYLGLGGRLGVDLPVSSWLFFRVQGDLVGNLYESKLVVGSTQAWTAPPVAGVLGLGVVASF